MQSDLIRSRPAPPFPSSETITQSAETLLLVDDEPMVREVAAQILSQQGYTVLEAASAAEALHLARESAPIHLLITDLSMPGVDGLELTRQFRAMHPETPMLMVSGSLPLLRGRTQDLDQFELLEKPFTFNDLLDKVRTILDAADSAPRRKP
jgi:two-component system cell cycle sensor histidine kinase/response regulator CckA